MPCYIKLAGGLKKDVFIATWIKTNTSLNKNVKLMSGKYKVGDDAIPHFMTFSVIGWIDVFSREQYKTIFIESLKHCQDKKGMVLHAWIIMTNHVHLIISSNTKRLEEIVRDLKKYTSKQIIKAIL